MSLIRGTSLKGYPELVTALGADPGPLLRAAGIPRSAVGDPGAFIPYRGLIAAVESAAETSGARDFGRRLALHQGIEILGPVALAALTAPTAIEALQTIDQYFATYSPAIRATVDISPGSPYARYEFQIVLPRLPPHQQLLELSLSVALRIYGLILGPGFQPVSVHLPHEALVAVRSYREYFDCPVRFAEPFCGFRFRRAELNRHLPSHTAVHDVVRAYLRSITPPADAPLPTAVRTLIRRLLPTGGLTLELVAGQLSIHPRTLQRQLAATGTSFESLVDDYRREETERCLRDTDIPLGQLAGLLGYSEQSVLTRACRRWFGASPSACRRNTRGRT
ncbi:AraC family transcriptional regulator [Streptomyces viridiviolaceus]|uniref:AraC family transcriptional regulator n=1 Tax=Streptomyces viridiviolaceus TaxID=68282 RepID=A0ABW2DTX0_9ACTN|nr:AraC family transcriptional regulator [Streptomyces viridiviolaceus]